MPDRETTTEIYLQYEDYITAGQMRDLLGHLDRLYDALYAGLTQSDPRRIGLQSRLRVSEVRTGDSLTLIIAEGVATLTTHGAVVVVPAALGIMGVAAKLIVSAAKGVVELRKSWHEGTKAKYEAKVARKEFREGQIPPEPDVRTIPDEARSVAANEATQIVNFIEYSPNILCLKVNGNTVVSKNGATRDKKG